MMMRMKLTFLLAILLFQLTISVKGGNPPSARRNSAPANLNHAPPGRSPDPGRRNSAPAALSSTGSKTKHCADPCRTPAPSHQNSTPAAPSIAVSYTFGDIIRFNRKKGTIPYNHYAIYVGNHDITGKKPEQDIFHFSGEITDPGNADCVFDSLADVTKDSTPVVQTEWAVVHLPRRTEAGMIEQIKRFHNNCRGEYNVIFANCEHLVTFIQFGSPVCEQKDTNEFIECFAKILCKANSPLFTNKRGRGRRGLGLLQDETRANQGAPAA
ncbi:uncharacterized protein LOC118965620 isoform X2 [Oncorhynchus mykiss]|uniref:uncharacterized protein LOC118965620 isoform X2 n=1 Tax=Oncorhynchus mykiss TaxID=8022 RepID=UPI0018787ADB|nr:uncharacterized protein LOC118965620 isoform X2 [Oncorhynchus mykiss]